MVIARMETHHVSGELCVGAKPQHTLGRCLLLCRVMAVTARNAFPFGPVWEAILLLSAHDVVVYAYLLACRSTEAGPGVQGYLL